MRLSSVTYRATYGFTLSETLTPIKVVRSTLFVHVLDVISSSTHLLLTCDVSIFDFLATAVFTDRQYNFVFSVY